MVIIIIYGSLAILLIFCEHQGTESESQEMEIGGAGPILTHNITKGSMVK